MNGNNKENAGEEIILTSHHEESAVGSQHLSGIIFPVLKTHYLIIFAGNTAKLLFFPSYQVQFLHLSAHWTGLAVMKGSALLSHRLVLGKNRLF